MKHKCFVCGKEYEKSIFVKLRCEQKAIPISSFANHDRAKIFDLCEEHAKMFYVVEQLTGDGRYDFEIVPEEN